MLWTPVRLAGSHLGGAQSGHDQRHADPLQSLERQSRDPDYLHVAYRIVAARALGHPVTRAESNRYLTGKAIAFAAGIRSTW